MRFVFLHTWDPYQLTKVGGIETFLRDLLDEFSETQKVIIHSWGNTRYLSNGSSKVKKVLRIRIVGLPDIVNFGFSVLCSPTIWKNRNTIFILQRPEFAFFLRKFFPHARIVIFLHTNQKLNSKTSSDSSWLHFPKIYEKFLPLCYSSADYIYSFSISSMSLILTHNSNCEHVLASASEIFLPSMDTNRSGVIWVGRLEKPKNPILAAKIIKECISIGVPADMIGEGTLKSEVSQISEESFTVKPFMSQKDLAHTYHQRKIVFMTSTFEGSPRTLVEALISGCVVVVNRESDPDELRKLFPDRVHLVEESTTESYVNTFLNLIEKTKPIKPLEFSEYSNLLNSRRMSYLSRCLRDLAISFEQKSRHK